MSAPGPAAIGRPPSSPRPDPELAGGSPEHPRGRGLSELVHDPLGVAPGALQDLEGMIPALDHVEGGALFESRLPSLATDGRSGNIQFKDLRRE